MSDKTGRLNSDAHVADDFGTGVVVVRKDTATALAGADGDYTFPISDADGRLHVSGPEVTTPTVYNVTLTVADTEYSQALTANTREFRFRCRTLYDVRYAFVTGKVATPTAPYLTLPGGSDYWSDNDKLAAVTLYFATDEADSGPGSTSTNSVSSGNCTSSRAVSARCTSMTLRRTSSTCSRASCR